MKKITKPKPRVATREQRLSSMFEATSDAYNNLLKSQTAILEENARLREENTKLRTILSRIEASTDSQETTDISEWDSVALNTDLAPDQVDDLPYGRNDKPFNTQRTTNDLYRMAKNKHEKSYAPPPRLKEYAEQEEEIEKAIEESRVTERPLDVRISQQKEQFYVNAGKTIMGAK